MGIKSALIQYEFGQGGSIYLSATTGAITPPTGKVFIAITAISDITFTTLTSTDNTIYMNSTIGVDGETGTGSVIGVIPAGMTIFGRWDSINIGSSIGAIAYIGE